jgi:hypothetical protein
MYTLKSGCEDMKEKAINRIISRSRELMYSTNFLLENRMNAKAFKRERKMGFVKLVQFLLNFIAKTLQLELDQFNELVGDESLSASKAAFSKARQYLSPKAFESLFRITTQEALNSDELKRYRGYRVLAIDGSAVQLERTKELLEHFGGQQSACSARASILCDVINDLVLDAKLTPFRTGERALAKLHLDAFLPHANNKDLIIFDRGYPSKELIAQFSDQPCKYLMRTSTSFLKVITNCTEKDSTMRVQYNDQWITIRIIKIELPTGEIETLITNLSKSEFRYDQFQELYFLRWPVEERYDTLKNKLALESFSGRKPIAIEQDFYATMYLANIVSFTKIEVDQAIQTQDADKALKHQYQANEKMIVGHLKNKLVLALIQSNPDLRQHLFDQVILTLTRYKVPIRHGRHFDRTKDLSIKPYKNKKHCL